jgi:hypothetical protein
MDALALKSEELANVRRSLNAALDMNQKLEWRDRVVARLNQRVDVLGARDAIALLRQIEVLL